MGRIMNFWSAKTVNWEYFSEDNKMLTKVGVIIMVGLPLMIWVNTSMSDSTNLILILLSIMNIKKV